MATNKSEAAEQRRARLLASSIKVFLGDWDRATAPAAQGSNKGSEQTPSKAKAAPGPQASKSKKSVPLDAKDEAMAKLMRDLDDKVNTAKRCKLEDMYLAVAGLEEHEQQALSSILAVYRTKLLPDKQANEASMGIRDALCAAAAAHSYHRPQTPDASKSTAAVFRQQGLPAQRALEAGFTAGQCLRAGYSTAELVADSGVPLEKLRAAGISVAELYSNLPAHAASQLSGVGGAAQLRAAGYTAGAVQEGAAAGAFSAWDLRAAGYHYTAAPPISCPPQDTTTSQQSPRNRPSHASAAAQQSFRQHRSHPNQTALLLQQQQEQIVKQGLGTAQQQQDLQYFRHQVVPLMQMKPEQHTPPLLLGTKGSAPGRHVMAAAAAAGGDAGGGPTALASAGRTSSSISIRAQQQRTKWQPSGGLSIRRKEASSGAVGHMMKEAAAAAAAVAGGYAPPPPATVDD